MQFYLYNGAFQWLKYSQRNFHFRIVLEMFRDLQKLQPKKAFKLLYCVFINIYTKFFIHSSYSFSLCFSHTPEFKHHSQNHFLIPLNCFMQISMVKFSIINFWYITSCVDNCVCIDLIFRRDQISFHLCLLSLLLAIHSRKRKSRKCEMNDRYWCLMSLYIYGFLLQCFSSKLIWYVCVVCITFFAWVRLSECATNEDEDDKFYVLL